jgi:hypothetical protein
LLPDYCAALTEQARETVDVPAKGKQPARKATVAMRYPRVSPAWLAQTKRWMARSA